MRSIYRLLSGFVTIVIISSLYACSGTTARIRVSDVNIERRPFNLVRYQLDNIDVSSSVSTFDSSSERENLKESLSKMIKRANLFGNDQAKPYKLKVNVDDFDIDHASF